MNSMMGNNGYRGNSTGVNSRNTMTGNVIPKGYQQGQLQQFNPEQQKLFGDLFSQVNPQSFLGQLSQGQGFDELEAPAFKQFNQLQGQLASRFSGMGLGGRKSSGFQNTANQASSDFAQQLQSNRMGLMRDALRDLMGYSNQLLGQRPTENLLVKKPESWWEKVLRGGAGAAVGGAQGYAQGGWRGAAMGASGGFGNAYGGQ